MPSPRRRGMSVVRGPSAERRAATPPFTATSARKAIFGDWWKRRRVTGSTSLSILPSRPRPITHLFASIRNGSSGVRTVRCSTRRILPRSTRTSTRSTSRARRGRRCGRSCATFSATGSGRECGSSGWTIRTPSPCRSGNGRCGRSRTSIRTSSSCPRRSPGRRSCTGWPRRGSANLIHILRGAIQSMNCVNILKRSPARR